MPATEALKLPFELALLQEDGGAAWSSSINVAPAAIGLPAQGRPATRADDRPRQVAQAALAVERPVVPSKAQRGTASSSALPEDFLRVAKAALCTQGGRPALSMANRVAGRARARSGPGRRLAVKS